jgi:hypothetical protein
MTCIYTVLNMGYKLDLHEHKEVVVWRSTYSLFVTNKAWKEDSLQGIKIV